MKECIRIVVTVLCLFAAKAEAREFAFDFSTQGMDDVSASVFSFSVGDTINLSLPDGQPSFSLVIVSAPPPGIAGQSFVAKDVESSASAIVKPRNGGVRITVDDFAGNKIYTFNIKDDKKTFAVHEKISDPDECATCNGLDNTIEAATNGVDTLGGSRLSQPGKTGATSTSRRLASSGAPFSLAEQKKVVDILVAFDQGAKAWAESVNWPDGDTIEEFADYAVNKMNMVLEKSQLLDKFSYRLVGIVEVDATYDVINNDLLNALRLRNNGALAPVGVAREKYGADTITLLIDRDRNKSTTSGQGYEYLSNSWSYAEFDAKGYTCNICDIKTVYERYTKSHETGHNMGCGHSNRQGSSSGPGCHPYSCGYHFQDEAGTNRYTIMAYENTSPASGTYYPVPYFSSPDITPEELGVPVGTPTNNNRLTILNNYKNVSEWREHVVPYSWDVRFLDDNGNDIPDGAYFYGSCYVTLTNENPEAEIYYTLDGSSPTADSLHGGSGTNVYMYLVTGPKTLTACAVVGGKAQSVRSITLHDGLTWSGDSNGAGLWLNGNSSMRPWSGEYFCNGDAVKFDDLAGNSCATVTVTGTVEPGSVAFSACETAYTFDSGDDEAKITIPDANFAPAGDVTFNLPVCLTATNFISPAGHTVTFNAPFGTNIVANASYGYCTNMIVVGDSGTLIVAPGAGKTQVFNRFNNTGNYYNTATLQIGEGTAVFYGPINGNKWLFGSTKIAVGDGGNLVFNVGGATGYGVSSTLTVSKGGTVTFNDMDHMNRKLILDGGTVRCKRLDWMNGTTISATDDSSIVENGSGGYVLIRNADATVDVSAGATLTLDVPITTGANTANYGFVKTGGGELLANRSMSYTGATVISNGTVSIGYSLSTRVGLGWSVASGATLKLKDGCSLAVPTLTLESGATLALSATNAAPLSATNNVSVAGVTIELSNATNLSVGASYPLLTSEGGISGVENVDGTRLPALASGLEWQMVVVNDTLYAKVVAGVVQFVVARGETVNLSDIPATVTSVIGEGTIYCGAMLPDASLGWTNAYWRGTLVFEGLVAGGATQNFQFELYGNANSKILLRNCSISYLKNNNATFSGTLVLEQDNDGHVALTTIDGYSGKYNIFGALEGNGAMSFATSQRQGYVFETATNYSGSISIDAKNNSGILGGRYIIFGTIASESELPANTNSATITVKPGATASIGGGATWFAYHGVDIAGTLLVKGANATLDCNASAAMGLKLGDGATLRFETADASLAFAKAPTFASGTNYIAFAGGVVPTNGMVLVRWPDGSAPAGDFVFADASVANEFALDKTSTGLVVKAAPLPAQVPVSITLRYWNDDAGRFEDRAFDFNLPAAWATNYYPSLDTAEAVSAKYTDTAANGATVWQCYMLGLDPTNQASKVSLAMTVEGNTIRFAVNGLGETHAIAGIGVNWAMKTSTNLVTDAGFTKTRETANGLSPTFADHPMPDKPTPYASDTSGTLFYKVNVSFVAE